MANESNNIEDSEKKTSSENKQIRNYLQPLFENISNLTGKEPPRYTTLMAVTVCVGMVTLIALPLGAVWISSNSECCFNDSLSNQLTFWAAMLAGFMAFFGIVISGLFVVFAFRIDYGATLQASKHAIKAVIKFIDLDPQKIIKKFFEKVKEFVSLASAAEEKIKNAEKKAEEEINKYILEFRSKIKKWDSEAEEIAQSMKKLKEKLKGADTEISQLVDNVRASSEAATKRIDELVNNVEQASDAALRRLQPPENRETDEDSGN